LLNFRPLTAEIDSLVCGTPTNFSGFRVLPSSLQRRRLPEANQTLHDVWQSPALLHYIYIFGSTCPPDRILPGAKLKLCVQVLRSLILAALLHGTPAAGVGQTLRRGTRNGITELSQWAQPIFGRAAINWASAHILAFLWPPCIAGCGHIYFRPVSFCLFSSPNLSGSRLDVYHTSTHDVVLVRI